MGYGDWTNSTQPRLEIKQTPPSDGTDMKFRLQITYDSAYSSPAVDIETEYIEAGTVTYRVGQDADTEYPPIQNYYAGYEGMTLEEDDSYYWRVMSWENSSSPASSTTWTEANDGNIAFKVDTNRPSKVLVTALQAKDGSANVDLSWTAATDSMSGVASYSIYRSTFGFINESNATEIASGLGSAVTSHTDTGTSYNTHYYYAVKAYDNATNAGLLSGKAEVTTTRRSIDGNKGDWIGTASSNINSSVVSENEWIWTDKQGERRLDSDHDNDVDIKEMRVTSDEENIYFLVEMSDITDTLYPNIAIGVDTDRNSSDSADAWLGDDSGVGIGEDYIIDAEAHYPEKNIIVHHTNDTSAWQIELYADDGSSWYSPIVLGGGTVNSSAANNIIEFKIAKSDLGISVGENTFRITAASFHQDQDDTTEGNSDSNWWANDEDLTADYSTCDALDSMSIVPISTGNYNDVNGDMNAWDEDISDGNIDFWADIYINSLGEVENIDPKSVGSPTPPDNGEVSAATTTLRFVDEGDLDSDTTDDEIVSYLLELSTFSSDLSDKVTYRINIDTNNWEFPANYLEVGNKNHWRVRARDKRGSLSSASTWSFTCTGLTGNDSPEIPSNVVLQSTSGSSTPSIWQNLEASVELASPADINGDSIAQYEYKWFMKSIGTLTWSLMKSSITSIDTNFLDWAETNEYEDWKVLVRVKDSNDAWSGWKESITISIEHLNVKPDQPHSITLVEGPPVPRDMNIVAHITDFDGNDNNNDNDGNIDPDDPGNNDTYYVNLYWYKADSYDSAFYLVKTESKLIPNSDPSAVVSSTITASETTYGEYWRLIARTVDPDGQLSYQYGQNSVYYIRTKTPNKSYTVDIAINEVYPGDPAGDGFYGTKNGDDGEYIELRNLTDFEIDITNWQISSALGGSDLEISSGTQSFSIGPNGYFLIANYSSADSDIDDSVDVDFIDPNLDIPDGSNASNTQWSLFEYFNVHSSTEISKAIAKVDGTESYSSIFGDLNSMERVDYTTATYKISSGNPTVSGSDAWEPATEQYNWDNAVQYGSPKYENSASSNAFWHNPTVQEPYSDEWMRTGESSIGYYANTNAPRKEDLTYLYVGGDPAGVSGGKDVYFKVRNPSDSATWSAWMILNNEFTMNGHDYFTRMPSAGFDHYSTIGSTWVKGNEVEYFFKVESSTSTNVQTIRYLAGSGSLIKSSVTARNNPYSYIIANSPPVAPDNPVYPINGQINVSSGTNILQVEASTGAVSNYFYDPDSGDGVKEIQYVISTDYNFTPGPATSSSTIIEALDSDSGNGKFDIPVSLGNKSHYFWKVKGRNASPDSEWGPWCAGISNFPLHGDNFWEFSTPGGDRIDPIFYYKQPTTGGSWSSISSGTIVYNDEKVQIRAKIYPGSTSSTSGQGSTRLRAYYTIDGSDPNTNFESGTDNYYFDGDWQGNDSKYGEAYSSYTITIPEDVHPAGSDINVQLSAFDVNGDTVPSASVTTYTIKDRPDNVLWRALKHRNEYATNSTSTVDGNSHLVKSIYEDSSGSDAYLYLLDENGKNTDNWGLNPANYLMPSRDKRIDVFAADSPKLYVRTGHGDIDTTNGGVKLYYNDQSGAGWRSEVMIPVTGSSNPSDTELTADGFSIGGVDDADPFTATYTDGAKKDQEYRRFTYFVTPDDWNQGEAPEGGEMLYYFEVIDGDPASEVFLADLSNNPTPYVTDSRGSAEGSPYFYRVLQDDYSRPYLYYSASQYDNQGWVSGDWASSQGRVSYNGYKWRPAEPKPDGGLHSIRSQYSFTARIFDDIEAADCHPAGKDSWEFFNAGKKGEDSGIYKSDDITERGSSNSGVHDTRVYFIISSTAPGNAAAVSGIDFSTYSFYFKGISPSNDNGVFITGDAAYGSNLYDSYDSNRDGYGYVQADSVPSGAGGNVSFTLEKSAGTPIDEAYMNVINGLDSDDSTSTWTRKYVYYRMYASNNDGDTQQYSATSHNYGVQVSERDGTGGLPQKNQHNGTNADIDRDHGWLMFPKYGGLLMRPPSVKITATVTISNVTKSVITYLKVDPSTGEIGDVISTHIGPETAE
ncbi:MAG: lamin tail domain-containing protein [Elusimicrobia bacterium]|nr:lamin tail domain-containing protein [Elusimicrobiota bacterium]